MRILPFKIPKSEQATFIFQVDDDESFFDKLHKHEEIQISLIFQGSGTLIIGSTVNFYNQGDIVVIGSNLPHVFKSDLKAHKESKMFTLFFTKDSFGKHFFELDPLKEMSPFFERAKYGFKILTKKKQLIKLFHSLENNNRHNQFIVLLKIIKICSTVNYISLSSFVYMRKFSEHEGKKIRDVIEYTMNNFQDEITLDCISNVAALNKNSFCKYFKTHTNKTYFEFLNKIRVEYASKLLINNTELQIAEIAFASGFKNISNFNRQFKKLKHQSPSGFRKKRI
ncbi:AraC family transcriptional regulator [Gelidibacter maritimus]|uniref:Helix-turn-helix domain-containing protein n=1 Tax=Gelidibacter maritimus TaxID=2761487 RepID=A0A7W2R5D0_9FLAO|nr:helix-turn-helix transcriptional regulator [Gelidibacter maritimus]MBA6154784.1 helix-turn-helix domain-containing protein [Gelidibacter maritimus]